MNKEKSHAIRAGFLCYAVRIDFLLSRENEKVVFRFRRSMQESRSSNLFHFKRRNVVYTEFVDQGLFGIDLRAVGYDPVRDVRNHSFYARAVCYPYGISAFKNKVPREVFAPTKGSTISSTSTLTSFSTRYCFSKAGSIISFLKRPRRFE